MSALGGFRGHCGVRNLLRELQLGVDAPSRVVAIVVLPASGNVRWGRSIAAARGPAPPFAVQTEDPAPLGAVVGKLAVWIPASLGG